MKPHNTQVLPEFWKGKRVFLTGHTGFKGGWMATWLKQMGAVVKGFSLPPSTHPALFHVANVADGMISEFGDIRDLSAITQSMQDFSPDILIHMAAQPLVRLSYREPVATYATNVMGTVHVLEAARRCTQLSAIINITTDKCYENREWEWGYRENEPMGGHDPYSSSKGCAELVTSAYRRSFFNGVDAAALASVRAGNVIGGGDWSEDRLIPDILQAFQASKPAIIRNPHAIRPWQHVLEPLSGYLLLAQKLSDGKHRQYADGWNFGPREEDAKSVQWIVEKMVALWGSDASWKLDGGEQLHEAHYLKLDISKARMHLQWSPRWDLNTALQKTIAWQQAWANNSDMHAVCLQQIHEYEQTES